MDATRFPVLMEMGTHLVRQERFHDAEQLMVEAREYAQSRPVVGWEDLAAEAMYNRLAAEGDRPPTARELAMALTSEKLYPAAMKNVIDAAMDRLAPRVWDSAKGM